MVARFETPKHASVVVSRCTRLSGTGQNPPQESVAHVGRKSAVHRHQAMRESTGTLRRSTRGGMRCCARKGPNRAVPHGLCESVHFRCPVCRLPLDTNSAASAQGGASLECLNRHNYSIAREGHVNLIRTGRRPRDGGTAGDEDGMVRARRSFFDGGYFSQVAEAISSAVVDGLQSTPGNRPNTRVAVLDAGCGEGTYIGRIQGALAERYSCDCFGLDISSLAVRLAAKKYPEVRFAVANAFDLPFADASMDCVVTAFAPWPAKEFRRMLRKGGFIVAAGPGPDHLMGIKRLLYRVPRPYTPRAYGSGTVGGALDLDDPDRPPAPEYEQQVRFELQVSGEDAKNLLQMTPYWWKARPEQQQAILTVGTVATSVDVLISRHRYS